MFHGLRSQTPLAAEDIETMDDGHEELLATIDYSVTAITWDKIKKEVSQDNESQTLLKWIRDGCNILKIPSALTSYKRHSIALRECEGVPMLGDRI